MSAVYRMKTGKDGISYTAWVSDVGNLVVQMRTKYAASKGIVSQHAAQHISHAGKVLVKFID